MLAKYKYMIYALILISSLILGYSKGYSDADTKHEKRNLIEENQTIKNTMDVIVVLNSRLNEANQEIMELERLSSKEQKEIIKEVVKYEKIYLEKDSNAKCIMDNDWMRIKSKAIRAANNTEPQSR